MVQDHIKLLGKKVSDKVTNFSGVVTTISFDLYGCIQAIVTPDSTSSIHTEGRWFDVSRLTIEDYIPVMEVPDFNDGSTRTAQGKKGAAEKPLRF